ncbi:MAG: peptidyl-prolyl cis-trans isomerase [Spirochaetaceae bacterium]
MRRVQPLIVVVILLAGAAAAPAQVLDKPVAVVSLHETADIGQRAMRLQSRVLEEQLGRALTSEERRELLQAQISEELINQAAAQANIRVGEREVEQAITNQRANLGRPVTEEQFRQLIEDQAGMTWQEYRDQIRQRLIQEKFVLQEKQDVFQAIQEPSAREVRRFYEENATDFSNPAMVRFDHIFVETRGSGGDTAQSKRDRIEELYDEIRSGESTFDEVADRSVDDAGYSAGDFGYLMRRDGNSRQLLGQDFIDEVFSIEEGDISDGVLKSNMGYHIVKVTNQRRARILDLNDPVLPGQNVTVRDQIVNYLLGNEQQRAFQRALEEVVQELRNQAEVRIFEENLDW